MTDFQQRGLAYLAGETFLDPTFDAVVDRAMSDWNPAPMGFDEFYNTLNTKDHDSEHIFGCADQHILDDIQAVFEIQADQEHTLVSSPISSKSDHSTKVDTDSLMARRSPSQRCEIICILVSNSARKRCKEPRLLHHNSYPICHHGRLRQRHKLTGISVLSSFHGTNFLRALKNKDTHRGY